jgi:hypothetical protein
MGLPASTHPRSFEYCLQTAWENWNVPGLSGTFSPFTHHPHTSPATPSTRVLRFQVYVSELQPLRRELVRQVFRRLRTE